MQITPSVPPITQLSYFQSGVRRIYLTATLPSQASFIRTFGISEQTIICPSGKSGDAQRLFIFVSGEDDESQRNEATKLVMDRKCCVISPSKKKGEDWVPPANIYDKNAGQDEIDRFSKSEDAEMLGLVARYDGIDLPGDACRLLILDRLPVGECLIDQFIDKSIRVEAIRMFHTSTRIVQAIGRIFRSNTDHGVVLLVGQQLQSWIRTPKNRTYLPKLLQQQVLLGNELSKKVESGETTWEDLIEGVLSGDEDWDELYNEYIEAFEISETAPPSDWHIKLILQERYALDQLWTGQYQQAADTYTKLAHDAQLYDSRLASWFHHWCGLTQLCANDRQEALHEFIVAANVRSELGRPSEKREAVFKASEVTEIGQQAKKLSNWYRNKKSQIPVALMQAEKDLVYGPNTTKAEEALKMLGILLGLNANRPDKTKKTGPDVSWQNEGSPSIWGFELKTNKNKDSEYSKKDIFQCHDHEEWLISNYGDDVELTIVGLMLPVAEKANPSPRLRITEIDAFRELLSRVKSMFEAVESSDKVNLEHTFQSWLNYYGLNWPNCVESLTSRLAVDLRGE